MIDLDTRALYGQLRRHLSESAGWPIRYDRGGVTIRTGFVAGIASRAYGSDTTLAAPLTEVVAGLADRSLELLPRWSREFVEGIVEHTATVGPDAADWILRVRYATPAPLKDREYRYYFGRRREPDGSVLIGYHSLADGPPAPRGAVRATLHPTVHRCRARPDGGVQLEHVLVTDLGGRLGGWVQNRLLVGSMVSAHVRDALALRDLFGGPS